MKTKNIVTLVLLLFILFSLIYLIAKEAYTGPKKPLMQERPATVKNTNQLSPESEKPKVVLYYFHGTARCQTCKKFESFTQEVLDEAFIDALNDGRLEWKVLNIDEPDNKHFVDDFQLHTRSIVIVKIENGKQSKHKNLQRIWELVGNKAAFKKYIQEQISSYLGASQ